MSAFPAPVPARTGACYIRVQVQGGGIWYRVVLNPDVLDPEGDRTHDLANLDDTIQLVHDFLTSFDPPAGR